MAFQKKASNLLEQLPPLNVLLSLIAMAESYDKNELARVILKRLRHAEQVYRKDLMALVKAEEQAARSPKSKAKRPLDLKSLEKAVNQSISMVEQLFARLGLSEVVTQVHADHAGPVDVGQALVKEARKVDDETMPALAAMLSKDLERFTSAKERVDKGGHPVLEDTAVKHATLVWRAIDAGKAVLGVLVLDEGRTFDAVLASVPTLKSPLRPELVLKDPAAPASKPARGRKKASKGDKSNDSGSTGGSTPAGSTPAA